MLVSIAIPTYNRKQIVEDKVTFILDIINDFTLANYFELLVIDNASTDGTYEGLSELLIASKNRFNIFRNATNIGLVGNCLKCIELSSGKYVWVIGDDDPIQRELFFEVKEILTKQNSDINILHLNHKCIDKSGGPVLISSFYGYAPTRFSGFGQDLFNDLISNNHTGGFMFISANILHKQKALEIIKNTKKQYKEMLGFPMFLNAYLALTGPLYYYAGVKLTCVYNQSSWIDSYIYLNTIELPALWIKLIRHGLTINNLRHLITKHSLLYTEQHFLSRVKEYTMNYKHFLRNVQTDVEKLILKARLYFALKFGL